MDTINKRQIFKNLGEKIFSKKWLFITVAVGTGLFGIVKIIQKIKNYVNSEKDHVELNPKNIEKLNSSTSFDFQDKSISNRKMKMKSKAVLQTKKIIKKSHFKLDDGIDDSDLFDELSTEINSEKKAINNSNFKNEYDTDKDPKGVDILNNSHSNNNSQGYVNVHSHHHHTTTTTTQHHLNYSLRKNLANNKKKTLDDVFFKLLDDLMKT